ncbi:multiubiquitin domain-containing protein [Roseibium sp.]|uniref:multiubiquitin domain-containing protein n=1 Tax=Roseibium sp. TaxID=1936156 RepID=UPI003B515213
MLEAAENLEYRLIVDDQELSSNDPVLTGRDILAIASRGPASGYIVVVFIERGTQLIGLDERIDVRELTSPRIRLFKGDRLFRALLNEREIVWGEARISALELRSIGEIPDDQDLYFDSKGDRVIDDDAVLSLKPKGVERFRSGDPENQTVDVVLNGEVTSIEKGRLSFSDLAKLAFPKLFGQALICFTVSFSRGPKRRREGVLLQGDNIRVVEGMVFNVSATDKS